MFARRRICVKYSCAAAFNITQGKTELSHSCILVRCFLERDHPKMITETLVGT
ncbi:unnamed protein product [Chondrus crispus]|uniref:Uncharacterized protein n=1 Tax=Chondrus crispus TaxID=2769 RepID=R7QNA5_CHOCR|nr:unnamed protein product [Chondrus crispus]CDF38951.1 unnamed protein product [Chondrus crispus]|eukprot:XP_005718856.1 unnamed protein product [Chondrus crispus]